MGVRTARPGVPGMECGRTWRSAAECSGTTAGLAAGASQLEGAVLALGGSEALGEVGSVQLTNVAEVDGVNVTRATTGALINACLDVDVDLVRALALLISKIRHPNHYTCNGFRV